MRSEQDIRRQCYKHTDLNEEEIEYLIGYMNELIRIACTEGVDVFINCMCSNKEESVTVAFAHCNNSSYNMSTIGYVIREIDEPALFRAIEFDTETKDIIAVSYVTTQGNMVIQHAIPIKYKGRIIGVLVREKPMTLQMKKANERIKSQWHPANSEQYPYLKNMDMLAECTDEAVIILNQKGIVVYRNLKAAQIYSHYGYIHDILGKKYNKISIHGAVKSGIGLEKAFFEKEQLCKGNYYRIKQYCYLDNEYFYILLISDITQKKKNEENLVHRSVAIREAHHRIKNNLQTIHSLLEMQYRRLDGVDAAMALQDAMCRIMSISTSYEALLTRGMDAVNLRDIIVEIRNKFMDLIESSPLEIQIDIRGDDFDVDADTSTNLALVINELLQNSFKHAFVGRDKGNIEIIITDRPVYSEIVVSDDGAGFDQSTFESQKKSMGLQIAKNIVEDKLKGSLDVQTGGNGTTVKFDFKTYKNQR